MKSPDVFWSWFAAHRHRFENLEVPNKDALLEEFLAVLHKVSEGLWFQIGMDPDGTHELVITAEGNEEFFADVEDLVAAAPAIEGWRVTAFKQAQGFGFSVGYNGVSVDPKQAWFLPLGSESRPEDLGLLIAVPGYDQEWAEEYLFACYILLDEGLGELRAAQDIQHVEVGPMPAAPQDEGYIELEELAPYLDWRASKRAQ